MLKKFLCVVVDRHTFEMDISTVAFDNEHFDEDLMLEDEVDRLTEVFAKKGNDDCPYWATCNVTKTPEEMFLKIAVDYRDFCRDELSRRVAV